jgi:succinate dehydrogenase / fumarate reductase membrane anchor subunit
MERFSSQWMKCCGLHHHRMHAVAMWVGMRDIWMDYIKPVGLRLGLQVFTIVWLTACAGWGIQITVAPVKQQKKLFEAILL